MNKWSKLAPKYDKSSNRWVVDIPASHLGKRQRHFFPTEIQAIAGSAEIALKLQMGEVPARTSTRKSIGDLAALYLARKEGELSKGSFKATRWGINALVKRFGEMTPDQLTPNMIDAWLASIDGETRTRFNLFTTGRSFYNWRGVAETGTTSPFIDPPKKQDKGHRIEILTPAQMKLLLKADFPPFIRAWILGGGFQGIRTEEQYRIRHESIDWKYDEITITKEDAKQGTACRPRSITITKPFKKHMHKGFGPYLDGKTRKHFEPWMPKVCGAMGVERWERNTLRHSFASYLLASTRDAVKTAYEMGHASPALLYQTYANTVSRQDAAAWWAL
jgi:integrase